MIFSNYVFWHKNCINIYDKFDTMEEANEYIEKNKNTVMTSILNVTNNKWNLIGPFKENRKT